MQKSGDSLIGYISRYIDLTSDEVDVLMSKFKMRKYLKGQYVVQQGDVCQFESFVVKGCLKTFHIDQNGLEHVVMLAVENWWCADLGSFITQTNADYNVQCLEHTEVLQISYDSLIQLYNDVPKMERFFRFIIQNAYVAAQKRIVLNLSQSAKERYLHFSKTYPEIERRVPQYLIASYLGMTKEFLSKIRQEIMTESHGN